MKRIARVLAGVVLLALTGASTAAAVDLTVSAAMSLKNAFTELGPIFEASHPGMRVYFNFASSGDLAHQIAGGAPADVYASASQRWMDFLAQQDLVLAETRRDFAGNRMVLIVPAGAPARVADFAGLVAAQVQHITIGNPASVPAGRYAAEVLRTLGVYDACASRLILGAHVRQVLDYVARGEVDAGIVYATDALSRSREVRQVAVAPPTSHTPVRYPLAVVRATGSELLARSFVSFVTTSAAAAEVLQRNGFEPLR